MCVCVCVCVCVTGGLASILLPERLDLMTRYERREERRRRRMEGWTGEGERAGREGKKIGRQKGQRSDKKEGRK